MSDLETLSAAVATRNMALLLSMARQSRSACAEKSEGKIERLTVTKDMTVTEVLAPLEGKENLLAVVLEPAEEKPPGIGWLMPLAILAITKPDLQLIMPQDQWAGDTLELAKLFCTLKTAVPQKGEAVAC